MLILCSQKKRHKPSPKIKENIYFSINKKSFIAKHKNSSIELVATSDSKKREEPTLKENQDAEENYYENTTFNSESKEAVSFLINDRQKG